MLSLVAETALLESAEGESMWPDRVLNSESLALESDALPTALRGPATRHGLILVRDSDKDFGLVILKTYNF